jgi:hypothetical protein
MEKKPNKKKQASKWIALINIPIQMGLSCLRMEETGLMKTTPTQKYITIKFSHGWCRFALYNVIGQGTK